MIVPKAAVDKDDSRVLWKHHVRCAGQITGMETIAKALGEKVLSNLSFELGILRSNRRHHLAPGFLVHCIRHFSLYQINLA